VNTWKTTNIANSGTCDKETCLDCGHERKWHWEAMDHSFICVTKTLSNEICKCRNFR